MQVFTVLLNLPTLIMKRPFRIFPSVGYKNSQFRILSQIDNLKIELLHNEKLEKTILTSQRSIEIIQKLDKSGSYIAKCEYQGEIFEQKIEVQSAFQLGSSVLKRAFVFDGAKYSFFLMKDRLLLYDEEKNILLTENQYSPTEILQIDKTNYLFVTKLGTDSRGITNLCVYNTESFLVLGELINDYQIIQISPQINKVWLFKKSSKSIHCFELINKINSVFTEIKKFENATNYKYNSATKRIIIKRKDRITFIDTGDMVKYTEIEKTSNNATDKRGYSFSFDKNQIKLISELDAFRVNINISGRSEFDNFSPNLNKLDYLHVGSNLVNQPTNFTEETKQIKDKLVAEKKLPKNE